MRDICIFDSREQLAGSVAEAFIQRMSEIQAQGADPHVALTGGRIADSIHHEIATLSAGGTVDWNRVTFWWSDERFVASDSPDRNALQARVALLDPIGATRVFEMPSSADAADPDAAAHAYGETMRANGSGEFDLVMLGIGPDGHVASLFPGFPQLDMEDSIAVGVHNSPKPPHERVSLTFPALNRARAVWFVASGQEKSDAVARALAAEGDVQHTPARGVHGRVETTWWLDRPAADHRPGTS